MTIEKNSRIEIGKTPAEDSCGDACCKITNGNPVYEEPNNCFDKIANIVYNIDQTTENNNELSTTNDSEGKPPTQST
jgi:hypothetical protein